MDVCARYKLIYYYRYEPTCFCKLVDCMKASSLLIYIELDSYAFWETFLHKAYIDLLYDQASHELAPYHENENDGKQHIPYFFLSRLDLSHLFIPQWNNILESFFNELNNQN